MGTSQRCRGKCVNANGLTKRLTAESKTACQWLTSIAAMRMVMCILVVAQILPKGRHIDTGGCQMRSGSVESRLPCGMPPGCGPYDEFGMITWLDDAPLPSRFDNADE